MSATLWSYINRSLIAISTLVTEISGDGRCLLGFARARVSMLVLVFSITTLSAMHIERYMCVVHALINRRSVTKRKIFKICYLCLLFLFGIVSHISLGYNAAVYSILSGLIVVIYLAMTMYVYARNVFAAWTRKTFSNSDIVSDTSQSPSDTRRTQRVFLKAIKLTKSCFLVVVCLFVCYVPFICVDALNLDGFYKSTALTWAGTLVLLNPSLNSIIFFWKNNLLRNESRGILKSICGQLKVARFSEH